MNLAPLRLLKRRRVLVNKTALQSNVAQILNLYVSDFKKDIIMGGMEQSKSFSTIDEFRLEDVIGHLSSLNLAAVTLGDYVMVMNGKVDLELGGEPYVALKLWFNIQNPRSCKFIARLWNETVAIGRIVNAEQFVKVCSDHLQKRPCIGYEANNVQDFATFQVSPQRQTSSACKKFLDPDTTDMSCQECLKFQPTPAKEEQQMEFKTDAEEIPLLLESADYSEAEGQIAQDVIISADFAVKKEINLSDVVESGPGGDDQTGVSSQVSTDVSLNLMGNVGPRRQKNRSIVWDHFQVAEDRSKAICVHCNKEVSDSWCHVCTGWPNCLLTRLC